MDPSPGGTGKQEQEWGEARPQRGECHNGGVSPSETIKLHLINPTGSASAGCCFPFAWAQPHFQGILGMSWIVQETLRNFCPNRASPGV